jgi:hypothetical protein
MAAAAIAAVGEPVSTTCWAARDLIDQLVNRYSIANLANVGNIEGWNVCKTGLINELRENPDDCFVLHDLSAESAEGLRRRLPRFDAVAVLEPSAFPPEFLTAAPGLNRAHPLISEIIQADPALVRLKGLPVEGLPALAIYIRRRNGAQDRAAPAEVSRADGLEPSARKCALTRPADCKRVEGPS